MTQEQIMALMQELRLLGMLQGLEQISSVPSMRKQSFEQRLYHLLDCEKRLRSQKRQQRLVRAAKLKQAQATLESIDYRHNRGIDKAYLESLCLCDWLDKQQHILITGATGTGKSWLACAFGNEAIRRDQQVIYKRFGLLLEELDIARRDGSLPKLRNQIAKAKLLILDDWALVPMSDIGRQQLLDLIEDLTGSGSIIITSQLPVNQWHEYIGEATYADAIMDRIVHRAHKIELHGDSMRRLEAVGGDNHDC